MEKTEHKVLVANRGEIAVRIVQACRKLGLEFVCVHTAEDIHSGHVRIAKELGGEKSLYQVTSYHDANEILSVADDAGATAIHPRLRFLRGRLPLRPPGHYQRTQADLHRPLMAGHPGARR